jgi:uncharacterized protein YraI
VLDVRCAALLRCGVVLMELGRAVGAAAAGLAVILVAPGCARAAATVECEDVAGVHALLVEASGRLTVRDLDAGTILITIDEADPGLAGGTISCGAGTAVVVPGVLSGDRVTKVLVRHDPDRPPRLVEAEGRVRVMWLPEAPRRARPQAAVAEAAPARVEAAPLPAAPPRPVPPPRMGSVEAAPPAAEEVHEQRSPGEPADFLAVSPPVRMVATLGTEVRSGPGRRFPVSQRLLAGQEVVVDGRAGDWMRTLPEGWVFGAYFAPPEDALQGGAFLARVDAVNAAVHAGPGAQHEIVAEVYRGDQVVIDEVKQEWAHVRNGGWVMVSQVTRQDAASQAPP